MLQINSITQSVFCVTTWEIRDSHTQEKGKKRKKESKLSCHVMWHCHNGDRWASGCVMAVYFLSSLGHSPPSLFPPLTPRAAYNRSVADVINDAMYRHYCGSKYNAMTWPWHMSVCLYSSFSLRTVPNECLDSNVDCSTRVTKLGRCSMKLLIKCPLIEIEVWFYPLFNDTKPSSLNCGQSSSGQGRSPQLKRQNIW